MASYLLFVVLATYVFFTLAYTAVNIPLVTLLSNETDVPKDRLNLNVFGTIGTNVGQLGVMMFALSLVQLLGGADEAKGYFLLAIIFGIIGAALLIMCSLTTKECLAQTSDTKTNLSPKQMLQSFSNAPWLIIAITFFLLIAAVVLRNTQTIYFCQYYLENQAYAAPLMSIMNVLGLPVAIVCPLLAGKFSKKNLIVASCFISALGCICSLFAGKNFILLMFFNAAISLGSAIISGIIYVMAAEAVDYGEFKHGFRSQGILMSVIAFAVKIANSVITMVASAVLNFNGYVGGADEQFPSAVNAIRVNYLVIPLIIFIVVGIINMFYTLDKKYPEVRAALDAKREQNINSSAE